MTATPAKSSGRLIVEAPKAVLPRLVLRFNRREYGRLTELIHRINALGLT